MRVVAFNCSPRKKGNTATMINVVLEELENAGISTELVQVGKKKIRGCIACYHCREHNDSRCHAGKECNILNDCLAKMIEADGIILGSPTYFADLTAEMKALIDRSGFVAGANGNLFKRKVGAAVVAVRRAGSIHVFDSINHFFLITQMIVPGSSYWNMGLGQEKGGVEQDEEGIRTMRVLGQNMAWLLKKL